MQPLRVIFMGTPAFAVPALHALIDSEHDVVAVYSQPPRPAGRGQKLTSSATHQLAEAHQIPVHHPVSLKSEEEQACFAAYGADVAVVAAYGLLLPQAILSAPRLGCINIHPSALPRFRGAAPIQRTIMAGDAYTECCIMQMDVGLDTGAVLARTPFAIPEAMTAGELHDAMATLGARMTLDVLSQMQQGTHNAIPQSIEGVTYAAKISKAESAIDWHQTATQIHALIRGLAPSPSATCLLPRGEIIKLCSAVRSDVSHALPAGTLINDSGLVACAHGTALQITSVQRAGKQRVSIEEFLRGYSLSKGEVLR